MHAAVAKEFASTNSEFQSRFLESQEAQRRRSELSAVAEIDSFIGDEFPFESSEHTSKYASVPLRILL